MAKSKMTMKPRNNNLKSANKGSIDKLLNCNNSFSDQSSQEKKSIIMNIVKNQDNEFQTTSSSNPELEQIWNELNSDNNNETIAYKYDNNITDNNITDNSDDYIKYTKDERLTSGGIYSATGSRHKDFYVSMYFGEFGLSGYNNITPSGKHRFFWNTIGGLGYAKSGRPNRKTDDSWARGKESFLWTTDINIGYSYTINKNFGANARYRSFITASHIVGESSHAREGFIVVHGPELGVTYNF